MITIARISKTLIAASLVLAALPLRAAAAPLADKKGSRYLIGLELYTVRSDMAKDVPGVLKAVSKMGYSGVEFAGYFGHTAQELRQMLDEDHLKCYGSHTPLDDLLGDKFQKTVEFNKVLGNKLIVIPWIPDERRNTRAHLLETCKLFNELAKRLKPFGIMLGYHDHEADFKQVDGEYVWDTIFGNTDKDMLIQFDTGNALQGGVQAAPFLTKFPGRLISAHVKDFSSTNSNALLGEGDVHWADVIPILKGKNGPRWFIIEQESYPFPPLDCAEKCLRTFEKMMGISEGARAPE